MVELKVEEQRVDYILESEIPLVGAPPQLRKRLEELILAIKTEAQLDILSTAALSSLLKEILSLHEQIMRQAADEISSKGSTDILGSEPDNFSAELSSALASATDVIKRRTAAVQNDPEGSALLHGQRSDRPAQYQFAPKPSVDNAPAQEDDATMSATTDKDYIDARLKAMSDSLDHRLETAAAKSDGRLEVIETRMDGRIASIESSMRASFAEFGAAQSKNNADVLKWIVATGLTVIGISLAALTFIITNARPKAPATPTAPLVIYAQPAPAAPITTPLPTTKP